MKTIITLRTGLLLAFIMALTNMVAQTTGDYRTTATATSMNSATGWETYNGTSWVTATNSPVLNAATVAIPNLYVNNDTSTIANITTSNVGNVVVDNSATLNIGGISTSNITFTCKTLTVKAGAKVFVTSNTNTKTNTLSLYGGVGVSVIDNNGTINLRTASDNNAGGNTSVVNTVFTTPGNTAITGASTTNFNKITLTMVAKTNILDVQSVITTAEPTATATPAPTLVLTSGTFKLSSASILTCFGGVVDTVKNSIPAAAGLHLNNAGAELNWASTTDATSTTAAVTVNGNLTIESGKLEVKARFNVPGAGSFNMSGGYLTIPGNFGPINANTNPMFYLQTTTTGSTSVTGGVINIGNYNSGRADRTDRDINLQANITGGTINVTTTASKVCLTSTYTGRPVYNLIVGSGATVAPTSGVTINGTLTLDGGIYDASTATGINFQSGDTPIVRTSNGGSIKVTNNATSLTFGATGFTGGSAFVIPSDIFSPTNPVINTLNINRTNELSLGNNNITIAGGTITSGTLTINTGKVLTNLGTLTNNGTITNNGSLINKTINPVSTFTFTVPATTTLANAIGDTYTADNGITYTVSVTRGANATGPTSFVATALTSSTTPAATGTLTKTSGTGDATIAYTAVTKLTTKGYLAGSSTVAVNNITQERYLSSNQRGWRLLSNPLATTTFGTLATNSTTPLTLGAGASGAYDSVTNTWSSGTDADNMVSQQAYKVFVRGITSEVTGTSYSVPTPSNVTVAVTGTYSNIEPTQVVTTAGKYYLVANPYTAPVSVASILAASSNLSTTVSYYNPTIGSSGSNADLILKYGGYTNPTVSGVAGSATDLVLPPMGAIFVQATSNGTIDVPKAAIFTGTVLGGSYNQKTAQTKVASTNTLKVEINSDGTYYDALALQFKAVGDSGSNIDFGKLPNTVLDLYSINGTNKMAVSELELKEQTIPLGITSTIQKSYSIKVAENTIPAGYDAVLVDNVLNTNTLMSPGTTYNFAIDSTPASQGDARFAINLKTSGALSLVEREFDSKIQLWPNPAAQGQFNILNAQNTNDGASTIEISSINGQVIHSQKSNPGTTTSIQTNGWAAGVYILKATNNGIQTTKKLIIQ